MNVYTILSVPTVISFPSPRCLRWSSGGQLVFITKSAVYILTPDHGINFDNESLIKSSIPKDLLGSQQPVAWFRTMVQDDKLMDGTRWPDLSQAWGAVSLGSIDASIMGAECSPSTVSNDGQSVVAVMTSNMDISLWKADKNYLKGEWKRIVDVTPMLLAHYGALGSADPSLASILRSQSTCMCWTSQPDFGMVPHPHIDGSLLVVGNRGGSLTFIRYGNSDLTRILETVQVTSGWVTQLGASDWTMIPDKNCTSYLAFGKGDGAVGLVKLEQTANPQETQFAFTTKYAVALSTELLQEPIIPSDNAGITAIEWIATTQGAVILIVCKPGVVYLWSPPESPGMAWTGVRSLDFELQKISSAASMYHPASGVSYAGTDDTLTLSLFDGSIHVIHQVTSNPQWTPPTVDTSWTSSKLSRTCRSIFNKVESGAIDDKVMNRISGFCSYDNSSSFVWAHESSVPSDFSYKHDAKHSSTIVAARLAEPIDDSEFLRRLEATLSLKCSVRRSISLNELRPIFFGLHNQRRLESVHDRLLGVLQKATEDYSLSVTVPVLEVPMTDEIRDSFRESLTLHLFGWAETSSLRMRLALADFMWKFSMTEKHRTECGQVAQGILNAISQRTLRTLIRHVSSAVSGLTADDIPFIMRLIVQSLLPGCPPDLSGEGQALSLSTQHLIPREDGPTPTNNDFTEQCPACHVAIPLEDINSAVCPNGHHWSRCSITTFILSTPWVRTCVGCSRKALLPPSVSRANTGAVQLPPLAKGWVVTELLETVHQCLFCNNTFVSLL
ncbi:hypothetical protein D9611_009127 [Ephemerocybe angulata]|uniref:Transcription factor IIIC 90kDa subunit N-terminal domain-containing protein n=1 Tax=Ephemerocybe angulata TaxID=980116 RepID=A0A8H5FKL7_9AGAR|nr:hypothetical protein D9611_009127 [Tulosesus angulatus]